MKPLFLYLFFTLVCFSSCKSTKTYQAKSYTFITDYRGNIQYFTKSKTPAKKIALIIDEPGSSVSWENNELFNLLKKEKYTIVLAENIQNNLSISDKEFWVDNILAGYHNLQQDSILSKNHNELIIIGINEGSYILHDLIYFLKPTTLFSINRGFKSPFEIIKFSLQDTSRNNYDMYYKPFRVSTKEQVEEMVHKVENNPEDYYDLGEKPNTYWLSFSKLDYQNQLIHRSIDEYLIFSEQRPLFENWEKKALPSYFIRHNLISEIINIPGIGDFSKEKEMLELVNIINTYINKQH